MEVTPFDYQDKSCEMNLVVLENKSPILSETFVFPLDSPS
jgi:hypothetical protein